MTNIGEKIKEFRNKKGVTQKELAEKMGLGQPQIGRWENGDRTPKPESLRKIADALELTTDERYELLIGEDGSGLFGENDTAFLEDELSRLFRQIQDKFFPGGSCSDFMYTDSIKGVIRAMLDEYDEETSAWLSTCLPFYIKERLRGKEFVLHDPSAGSDNEKNMIEKYHVLDKYGKKNVTMILDNEFERCTQTDREEEDPAPEESPDAVKTR